MYYVITVKGRRRRRPYIDDPWEEYYYNYSQSYWCRNFYLATFLTDLGVAKSYLSELEYKDSEDYEYDKNSVVIKKVAICDVEDVEAPKTEDSAVSGYVITVFNNSHDSKQYFSIGGGWTRYIESALIFPAVELAEQTINDEQVFYEEGKFDIGSLAIEALTVTSVKNIDFFGTKWRWKPFDDGRYMCPECHSLVKFSDGTVELYAYCPHCGAKMIREAGEVME